MKNKESISEIIRRIVKEELSKSDRNLCGQIANDIGLKMFDVVNFVKQSNIDINKLKSYLDTNQNAKTTLKNAITGDHNNLQYKSIIQKLKD